jgi:hypothetical protein
MANGQPYKGPCWCHEIVVPEGVLKRLAEVLSSDSCLCRSCLETVARLARGQNDADVVLVEARKVISAGLAAAEGTERR